MEMINIKKIIEDVAKKCGCECEVKFSKTTNSLYADFLYNGSKMSVRFSDHFKDKTQTISTYRVDMSKNNKIINLQRYIKNRCEDLKKRNVEDIFTKIQGEKK